jgi:urease accessory protein UreF
MKRAARRFGRLFQARAGCVVQPTVERTAQAAILAAAEREIGAAVRAMAVEQADAAGLVPEQHQVFAQQTDALHRTRLVDSSISAAGCQ